VGGRDDLNKVVLCQAHRQVVGFEGREGGREGGKEKERRGQSLWGWATSQTHDHPVMDSESPPSLPPSRPPSLPPAPLPPLPQGAWCPMSWLWV